MKCQWQQINERTWLCTICGRVIGVPLGEDGKPLEPNWDAMPDCPGRKDGQPNMVRRISNYARAVQRWIKAGSPVRSDDRVVEIYETKCRPCRHFDQNRETCTICGCFVRRSGSALRNKIKMATERCPADPPLWTEEVEVTDNDDENADMYDLFEAVFVVNLDRRMDRWTSFQAGLPPDWPFRPPVRWSAVDGQKCPPPPWWSAGKGAWGCYRSHLAIIEHCLNNGINSVLIMEDDAIFRQDFTERLKRFIAMLSERKGMIYFGGQHLFQLAHPPKKVNDEVYLAYNVNRTHAYGFLDRESMAIAYKHLNKHDWKPKHHIDHHYGRLHESGAVSVYCPPRWLVGQRAGKSNISGKETANDQFWQGAAMVLNKNAPRINPVVAVVGPFRSGTSCVAGILHTLGISMGAQLLSPEQTKHFNPKGTFEAVWLARMCRRFFKEPEMIEQVPRPQRIAELRRWAEERTRQVGSGKLIGAKHPTLCLMVEDMVEAWPGLKIIAVDRPVEQIVASALAVGWLPTAREVIPMMVTARDTALTRVNVPVLRINYEDVVTNPRDTCSALIEFCSIAPSADQMEMAIQFVDKKLKHF